MHLFRSHGDKAGMFRGHAHLGLPENPICWLTGHRPKVKILDFRSAGELLIVECRICGRRYHGDDEMVRKATSEPFVEGGSMTYAEHYAAIRAARDDVRARRLENARRDPKGFTAHMDRRAGYAAGELNVSLEALWLPRYHGRRGAGWREWGFRLHIGNRSSETPIDANVHLGPAAAYLTIGGVGNRLAQLLGRGHKRDLRLEVRGGELRWSLWYDDDGGNDRYHDCDPWRRPKLWPWSAGRDKYRPWMCLRDGHLDLNPVTAFWGRRMWLQDETFPERTVSAFVNVGDWADDFYLVDFTLERREVRRKTGPSWARRVKRVDYSADARCEPGIPVRNHDWKGDEITGWSARIPAELVEQAIAAGDNRWADAAVEETVELVKRDRTRYGYQPPRGAAV